MSVYRLGPFEEAVLLAILRLKDDAYGVSIVEDLEQRLRRRVTVGAAYATLDRLEQNGLVAAQMGEPTAKRGGRAKKYFRLTASGAKALEAARRRMHHVWSGVSKPVVAPT